MEGANAIEVMLTPMQKPSSHCDTPKLSCPSTVLLTPSPQKPLGQNETPKGVINRRYALRRQLSFYFPNCTSEDETCTPPNAILAPAPELNAPKCKRVVKPPQELGDTPTRVRCDRCVHTLELGDDA